MAAGSDLLDEVFFNSEVDEKVVSDLVGSLESQLAASAAHHHHLAPRAPAAALGNHAGAGAAEGAPAAAPEPPPAGTARRGLGRAEAAGPASSPRRRLSPQGQPPS